MMFRFEWKNFIFPEFIEKLNVLAGFEPMPVSNTVVSCLASILQSTGGLPLANAEWDTSHRSVVMEKLLHEAIIRLLKLRYGFRQKVPGFIEKVQNGLQIVESKARVDVNHASEEVLEALPIIGKAIAKRIVETRRNQGPYTSLKDLERKISGLGASNTEELSGILAFFPDGRTQQPIITGVFEDDFKSVLGISRIGNEANSLEGLLEEITVFVAANPHPASKLGLKRADLEPSAFQASPTSMVNANFVALLTDGNYYQKLLNLINEAQKSISVCMFYIALGNENHPTRQLLEALVKKAGEGCQVKVLIDQDNINDPYGSRIINARAARFLIERGVEVKTDQRASLLHSKFVLIDNDKVVIGSHNWTTGSYFNYKDLSLLLNGKEVFNLWENRFANLWEDAFVFNS